MNEYITITNRQNKTYTSKLSKNKFVQLASINAIETLDSKYKLG